MRWLVGRKSQPGCEGGGLDRSWMRADSLARLEDLLALGGCEKDVKWWWVPKRNHDKQQRLELA